MPSLERDPLVNAVHNGIKQDIQILLEHGGFRGATLLMYAAIDAMAFTTLPAGRNEVTKSDFIAWADRYIRFPGPHQVSGLELYGARCAMLHTYGSESKLSRESKCRCVLHAAGGLPVLSNPQQPDAVLLNIFALRAALFAGIDEYLGEHYHDPVRWPEIERRLHEFNQLIPYERPTTG